MFETTVVESRIDHSSRTRVMTFPVSIGLHAVVISGAILANVWTVTMPNVSPPQFKAFIAPTLPVLPMPVKPRPPRQPEPQQPEPVQSQAPPAGPVVDAPPTRIPDAIPVLNPNENTGPVGRDVIWNFSGHETSATYGFDAPSLPVGPQQVGPGGATRPVTIHRVEPVYPPLLVRLKLKGSATVECIVDETGQITSATVVNATHPLFGESAREAVLQWRFRPGRLNGDPVSTIFQLTVNFEVKR